MIDSRVNTQTTAPITLESLKTLEIALTDRPPNVRPATNILHLLSASNLPSLDKVIIRSEGGFPFLNEFLSAHSSGIERIVVRLWSMEQSPPLQLILRGARCRPAVCI